MVETRNKMKSKYKNKMGASSLDQSLLNNSDHEQSHHLEGGGGDSNMAGDHSLDNLRGAPGDFNDTHITHSVLL